MTTIVWDGRYLATDGQESTGNYICNNNCNKIYLPSNTEYRGSKILAVAGSGSSADICNLLEQLEVGQYENKELDAQLIIITFSHVYSIYSQLLYTEPDTAPFIGLGSGHKFALGAIASGMNAMEAVQVASAFDVYTNSNIKYVNIEEVRKEVRNSALYKVKLLKWRK